MYTRQQDVSGLVSKQDNVVPMPRLYGDVSETFPSC